jgi:hypothetical protein
MLRLVGAREKKHRERKAGRWQFPAERALSDNIYCYVLIVPTSIFLTKV